MILTHQERSVPLEYRVRPATIQTAAMSTQDRRTLAEHIGRDAIQGNQDRQFEKGWLTSSSGSKTPRCYRVDSPAFSRCQYAVLATPERAAVLVVDVDRTGTAGGGIEHLNSQVRARFDALARAGRGPAYVGVNPLNGKCQAIWLVDPVYAGKGRKSPNRRLYDVTADALASILDGDTHFAGAWSRNPFYQGNSPHAYRWHAQHGQIDRVRDLRDAAGAIGDMKTAAHKPKKDEFTSGRALLEAVQARRAEAVAARDLLDGLGDDGLSAEFAEVDRRAGVRILWIIDGVRAARDETAFRHALAEGYKLKAAGKRLKDAPIIDAYECGYNAAQAAGADGRAAEMPSAQDRATMARRVRAYVSRGGTSAPGRPEAVSGRVSAPQRAALATLGRRGAAVSNARRWSERGEAAEAALAPLSAANARRRVEAAEVRSRVLAAFSGGLRDTGRAPSLSEVAREAGISRTSASRHLAALREAGILPTL